MIIHKIMNILTIYCINRIHIKSMKKKYIIKIQFILKFNLQIYKSIIKLINVKVIKKGLFYFYVSFLNK